MKLNKKDMILTLEEIKTEQNVNIDKYKNDIIMNDIPSEALKFINLYKPLDDLGVFNLIYSKRRKTPLFHNFKMGNIDNYEQVVCLGSLLTQMLCYIKTTKDDVVKHSNIIGIKSIIHALDKFTSTGDFTEINIVYNKFSLLFKDLFNKDGDN